MFTRETKIFMIVGFVTLLGVSMLFVDHLSGTNRDTPAGPLDVDRLVSDGLVISVIPGNEPRAMQLATDPFRGMIGGGLDQLARGSEDAIGLVTGGIEDWRNNVTPPPVLALQGSETGASNDAAEDDVPTVEMGKRGETDEEGRFVQLAVEQVHRVVAGDTLWRIAEQYYGEPSLHAALAEYNKDRLTAAGQPRAGATVLIPPRALLVPGAQPPPTVRVTLPETRPSNQPVVQPRPPVLAATRTYEVKRGDTLSQISQRELGTARRWREILELNADRLKEPADIWVGMKLKLPAK